MLQVFQVFVGVVMSMLSLLTFSVAIQCTFDQEDKGIILLIFILAFFFGSSGALLLL